MSSTRKPKRTGNDHYETPHWVCQAVAGRAAKHMYSPPDTVIDMGAGDGRIARAVTSAMLHRWELAAEPDSYLIDVEPRGESAHDREHWIHGDARQEIGKYLHGRVLLIGNPPFSLADEFVRLAVEAMNTCRPSSVAVFLLRLNWLGSLKRSAWLKLNPPVAITVLAPRPSFCGGGADSCEYAWIWWSSDSDFRVPHFDVAVRPDRKGQRKLI